MLAQACRRAGLPVLAETVDVEDPEGTLERLAARLVASDGLVLAVADAHRASAATAEWLARLAETIPRHVRLVIAGRRLDRELAGLVDRIDAVALGADALPLDATEVAALLGADLAAEADRDQVAVIVETTDGRPAAVTLTSVLPGHDPVASRVPAAPSQVLPAGYGDRDRSDGGGSPRPAGRALLREGRSAAVRRVADRALTLCAELDVEPGDDLARFLKDLARQV